MFSQLQPAGSRAEGKHEHEQALELAREGPVIENSNVWMGYLMPRCCLSGLVSTPAMACAIRSVLYCKRESYAPEFWVSQCTTR